MKREGENRERSRQPGKIVLEEKLGEGKLKGRRTKTVLRRTVAHHDIHQIKTTALINTKLSLVRPETAV